MTRHGGRTRASLRSLTSYALTTGLAVLHASLVDTQAQQMPDGSGRRPFIAGENAEAIRQRAARAYNKYQKCGDRAASRLFATGYGASAR